jgi:ATP-dependent Clp protease adaptor protein ClpS
VAELVDAAGLGPAGRKPLEVRVLSPASRPRAGGCDRATENVDRYPPSRAFSVGWQRHRSCTTCAGVDRPAGAVRPRLLYAWNVAQTLTPPKERLDRGDRSGLGGPTRVVVLNDNHNTFDGVASSLAAVLPGVSYDRGMQLANQIHNRGLAIVWSGHREVAELYWQELRDRGLTMAPLE